MLLVEQVDRISRLTTNDWKILKNAITQKGIRIVSLDLATSHQFIQQSDEFTERMMSALNALMLDMLAAVAHKTMKTVGAEKHREFSAPNSRANTRGGLIT